MPSVRPGRRWRDSNPKTEGSLQISGRVHYPLCHRMRPKGLSVLCGSDATRPIGLLVTVLNIPDGRKQAPRRYNVRQPNTERRSNAKLISVSFTVTMVNQPNNFRCKSSDKMGQS
ncbi:methylcytosine dioxygenase tet1 [Plakobranchus ocellatus]|uniref:Methylcytosine dioxygenase tet1 n=1 Tax=Plakobranchus ocellatus TaxID=259542 RepID=A0AAV3YZJ7_9GAST|nr:methylcytosine dioxygenase tet1 [Plakobranchus ocellatus]